MTAIEPGFVRVLEPAHQFTILGLGGGLKAGRCRCGWNAIASKDQDDLGSQFATHRATAPGPVLPVCDCDCCCQRAATVRHGCVDLCAMCALDELVRNDELEVVA